MINLRENSPEKMIHVCEERELVGKISGFDGIFEKAHTCSIGGHSKNIWFIDSSSVPHLAHHISFVSLALADKHLFILVVNK